MSEKKPWLSQDLEYLKAEFARDPDGIDRIAARLNRSKTACRLKLRSMGIKCADYYEPVVSVPSKPGRSAEEVLSYMRVAHQRKREYHEGKRKIPVRFDVEGAFGIALFGDLHGDDEGCDIALFETHCQMIRESGLPILSFNLGDFSNNWVGKLSHLWAHQSTTEGEARQLIEYALRSLNWTAVILGNHDVWTPVCEMICNRLGVKAVTHGGKFYVTTPSGQVILDLAHHHRGTSMYNPAHGQTKKAYRGSDADIIAGGHIHSSSCHQTINPETGRITWAARVSSYKVVDEFADRLGFGDENISPCIMFVCDPSKAAHRRVNYFSDPEDGIEFLRAVRGG